MAKVVVVGGGIAGMATAARLAKLGHQVTLLESDPSLGGALKPISAAGREWDVVHAIGLPGVLRDLFRKSGRPMEREVDFVRTDVIREHVFTAALAPTRRGRRAGTPMPSVVMDTGRAAQTRAIERLGVGLGTRWVAWVNSFADEWEQLRRHRFEAHDPDWDPRHLGRGSLARRAATLKDPRLIRMATHPWILAGHDPNRVPGWAGMISYLEMTFGTWQVPGGTRDLIDALDRRLATRRVTVRTGVRVEDLVVAGGRVKGVETAVGPVPAEVVVVACDPRSLPSLDTAATPSRPAYGPGLTLLALDHAAPEVGHEMVFAGEPTIVVRPSVTDPRAWTVLTGGRSDQDVLVALARRPWLGPDGSIRHLDVRSHVVARTDLSATDQTARWHGNPLGVAWTGGGNRLGPTTPIAGVYAGGAWSTGGLDLPFAALTASVVAGLVGPA
ncbi:MAG: phytoene desaturase family protein [Nocardioides sp.]